MTVDNITNVNPEAYKRGGLFSWLTRVMRLGLFLSVIGLVGLNVLTLINDQVHSALYHSLRSLLSALIPDNAWVNRKLENSPTKKREREVVSATKDLREKHAQLNRDKRKLLNENQSLNHSKEQLEKDNILLRHEKQGLELQKVQLDKDNNLLRNNKYGLELQNQQLKKDNQALGGNNKVLKLKTQALGKELGQRYQKAWIVSSRLSRRHYRSGVRNLASLPGEALPFVGIPIAVAGVALDVADSCETLRDLNELHRAFGLPEIQEAKVICDNTKLIPTTDALVTQISHGWESAYQNSVVAINNAQKSVPRVPKLPMQPPNPIDIIRSDGCRIFGSNLNILGVGCN